MSEIEAVIPGAAMRHLHEIADPNREWELFAFREIGRRRYGRGYAVTISIARANAAAMASRLRGLAEVERDVRAYGNEADSAIERACDKGAERLEAALSK